MHSCKVLKMTLFRQQRPRSFEGNIKLFHRTFLGSVTRTYNPAHLILYPALEMEHIPVSPLYFYPATYLSNFPYPLSRLNIKPHPASRQSDVGPSGMRFTIVLAIASIFFLGETRTNPSSPTSRRSYDLPRTSSGAVSLSYL